MSYFTLKNGMKLYYEDKGEGQTVIMMHGWSSSHRIYVAPVKELCKKARCIIFDQRGHGESRSAASEPVTLETLAGDLNELICGLQLKDVTLVGWSMGAAAAMTYIREYGCGALRQVVLCDMTPKQVNDASWRLGLYRGKYTAEDMRRDADKKFISVYLKFAVAALPKLEKIPELVLRPILRRRLEDCDETVLRNLSRSMKEADNREVIGKISVPVTYIYALPGSLFSPELAKWYEENVQAPFRAIAIKDSSHMLISEHPEEFAMEIGRLL